MSEWVPLPAPFELWRTPDDTDLNGPGVYHWSDGERSYVGMAANVWSRLGDHRRAGALMNPKTGAVYPTATVMGAARLERALIWMLNPTENESRPKPTIGVWAGTLGRRRPVTGWSWYQNCGHVKYRGKSLVDWDDWIETKCRCKPFDWERLVRAYVGQLERDRDTARRESHEWAAAVREDEYYEAKLAERQEEISELQDEITRLMAENETLEAKRSELEELRESSEWYP